QDKDMTDYSYFDAGDIELPMGSSEMALAQIEDMAREILRDGKIPLMLGGEHLVTLGAVRAVHEKYSDLYIIQFDAHADLRDDYLGVKNSHACVMRRCYDIVGEKHIYQHGIRSGERTEFAFAKEHTVMSPFDLSGVDGTVEALRGKNVYLTIDMDVLDPSEFPGTGTPEAGGARYNELLAALDKITSQLNIVALDMNELSPTYDPSGISTALCCKLLRELLLMMSR
ncbi:MAG: agmatinase, partial [Oscillospiraceae bacterium]